jgi:hypothetical protein
MRNARNILAATIGLAASDLNARPGPIRAGSTATDNRDIVPAGRHGAFTTDVLHGQVGDGDAGRRVALEIAAVVVLFDEDTVP